MVLESIPKESVISTRDIEKMLEKTYGGRIEITFHDYREGQYVEQKVMQYKEGKPDLLLFRYLADPKHNQMKVIIKNLLYDYVESLETGSIRYMGNLANQE